MAWIAQALSEQLVSGLVGRPFAWGGRGPDAYDCWGVVLEVTRSMGIDGLPGYDAVDAPQIAAQVIAEESGYARWEPIALANAGPGDVILLSMRPGAFHHAGVMTPWGILHAAPRRGVVLLPLAHLDTVGGFRYRKAYRWRG